MHGAPTHQLPGGCPPCALCAKRPSTAWASAGALIPDERAAHPLGGGRPRVEDRACFDSIVVRLVTGCSSDTTAILSPASVPEATLRRRYGSWNIAGVFDWVAEEAIESYDRIVGLGYTAACGGRVGAQNPLRRPGTGRSPVARAKSGWKLSLLSDAAGIPLGWAADTAGRHDSKLLAPTLASAERLGVIPHFETLLADRGHAGRPARECAESFGSSTSTAPPQPQRPSQAHPAGRASGHRAGQLTDVALRSDPSQHRPLRPDRTGRSVDPHRRTHRLAEPLPTHLGGY